MGYSWTMESTRSNRIEDDYKLPSQPAWNENQIVRVSQIGLSSQDSDQDDRTFTTDQVLAGMRGGRQRTLRHFTLTPSNPSLAQIQEQQPKFDPTTHHFSPEELKPTPIQKKSRKQLVREEDKDEKYWDKRRKNNQAAKRSREARRSRENQISMRASFLEKDNAMLKEELLTVKEELQSLREKLLLVTQQSELQLAKCQNNNWW